MSNNKKMTMGLIIGNRGFFPDHLAKTGREDMMRVLEQAGMDCIVLTPDESKYGAVETHEEAKRCAALFHFPTSATNVPLPTLSASPAFTFPSSSRPHLTSPIR
jgi:L-fucose isomerase-like protein